MSTTPHDEVPDLKVPDWVPPVVKYAAQNIYSLELRKGPSVDRDRITRLTCDERMKKVWRELESKTFASSLSTEHFVSPLFFYYNCVAQAQRNLAAELRKKGGEVNEREAQSLEGEAKSFDRLDRSEAPGAWAGKDCALYGFFYRAYYIAQDLRPLLSRVDIKTLFDDYSNVTKQFDHLSDELCSLGFDYFADELATIAKQVAKEMEDRKLYIYCDSYCGDLRVVERRRPDCLLQSYVVRLAGITHVIFGSPLYGTLAVTANVALNPQRPIVLSRVRNLVRSFPFTGFGIDTDIPWD